MTEVLRIHGTEYNIPKGTTVYGNIVGINNNKHYFEDELNSGNVFEFNPKRFLTINNNDNDNDNDNDNEIQLATWGAGYRNFA